MSRLARCTAATAAVLAAAALAGWPARPNGADSAESFARFCCDVVPVLDRRCGGCHGVSQKEHDALEQEPLNRLRLHWVVDGGGRIATDAQRRAAFERCTRARTAGDRRFDPLDRGGPVLASALVRAPLGERLGGRAHPEIFSSTHDRDFAALAEWAAAEIAARPEPPAVLGPVAETFFATKVAPVLERKTCLGANCHGPRAFNDLKLDPGIPTLPERFTPAIHRANRLAMLGEVTRLANLSGDVAQSKQVLKSIPVDAGGIVHKGGNAFFAVGDPDYEVMREWLEMEQTEARVAVPGPWGPARGVVFVRRPRTTPERYFEGLEFLPGADLIWRHEDGRETNLTAALHPDGPADVRAPDVSYDARRVVFAMRRTTAEPFNVWEVELETGAARALTFSTDAAVHFVDPIYAPNPEDPDGRALAAADLIVLSNRAGDVCAVSPDGVLGEAEGGTEHAIADDERTERAGTFDGRRLRVVRGTNRGEARTIARQERGRIVVDRPFPSPCDATTHYVIATPVRTAPKFDLYRMRLAPRGEERQAFPESLRRMTWSPSQVRGPSLRSSGEIMATFLRTGWQGGRPVFNGAIFRTHADGSNFHTHAGNRSGVPIHADNHEMPNGLEVRIGRDADSWWGGTLILSDHQFGPSVEDRNPTDDLDHPYRDGAPRTAQVKFVPGWIALDPTVTVAGVSPRGAYHDAYPMLDGSILVSYAPGPVDLGDRDAAPDFDILRLVPAPAFQSPDGASAGAFRRERLVTGPDAELWPRPVVPRLKEPVRKTLATDEDLLGRAHAERGLRRHPPDTPALLQVFDLPLLDAFFEQSTPVGIRHLAAEVCPTCGGTTPEHDVVRFARIVGLEPQRNHGAPPARRFIIAEVPVAADGSISVAIPPGTPFDIQSLNGERMALRSPHRWLYALPGERHALSIPRPLYAQTCGGCHGGLAGSPAGVLGRPDVVTSASRTLATWDPDAGRKRRPSNWQDGRPAPSVSVVFERDVRPLVERRCGACHAGTDAGAGVDLTGAAAYASLLSFIDRDDRRAIRSPLIEKLTGRRLHAERPLGGETPHPREAPLAGDELLTLIRWIDLGAES